MKKERLMALFIGAIMIMSTIGFSLSSIRLSDQQTTGPDISFIMNRELKSEELIYALQTGRVVVEDFYEANCTECPGRTKALESFFGSFTNYVVIEEAEANQTSLKIIGAGGRIKDLTGSELNETFLMDTFCELAIAQPRECLLENI